MHRSWSVPVAQALQRHSGGWTAKPTENGAETENSAASPATPMPQYGTESAKDRCSPAGATPLASVPIPKFANPRGAL
jgi:hypothetical protein